MEEAKLEAARLASLFEQAEFEAVGKRKSVRVQDDQEDWEMSHTNVEGFGYPTASLK